MGWIGGEVGCTGGFVGGTGVFTTTVAGAKVEAGIEVAPDCGSAVRGVAVSMKKRIGVDEGVLVNVKVTVGVTVGVFVLVGVGPVAVGNGP